MKFHHQGYVSTDPRVQPVAGTGIDRPDDLPDQVDVLIVGAGPAGLITAAQLSQFPDINTRIIDRRSGRLAVGRADGIQKRSVETFEAFGFAQRITAEACQITETAFWQPDAEAPANIARVSRVNEDPNGVSEYPHLIVNQARVLDYFSEFMAHAPTRMTTDYGWAFDRLERTADEDYPLTVTVDAATDGKRSQPRTIQAKYVVGADGAHSRVRKSIGCQLSGSSSNHAWGVLDVLAVTDFPDVRVKCVIQSEQHGSILLIPREGGHLIRLYVDLGDIAAGERSSVRQTTAEQAIEQAAKILHPYTLDVREVVWYSVYEVGHRVCDRFDDVPLAEVGQLTPRVFIVGDAGHTHSAKAGQGMNVSMQDGFNLGWKLGHVLTGHSPESLLATYSAERQVIGQDIIDFDERWAREMATSPDEHETASEVEAAYVRITEFAQGFMTRYPASIICGDAEYQALAPGFAIGKRFKSAWVTRVADACTLHIGHEAKADGRWRLYVFADAKPAGHRDSKAAQFGQWLQGQSDAPACLRRSSQADGHGGCEFDIKLIYQQRHSEVDLNDVPRAYMPRVGKLELVDYDGVFARAADSDIFHQRSISRDGALVVVRPDQYVAHVLPLTATDALAAFIRQLRANPVASGGTG